MPSKVGYNISRIEPGKVYTGHTLKNKDGTLMPYYLVMKLRDKREKEARAKGHCNHSFVINRVEDILDAEPKEKAGND